MTDAVAIKKTMLTIELVCARKAPSLLAFFRVNIITYKRTYVGRIRTFESILIIDVLLDLKNESFDL